MLEGPLLWFVNRGTGVVLLVLLTLSTLLGVVSTRIRGGRVPQFAYQHLHRNLGLISVLLLAVHAASAVVDTFVDIRWWQVFVPWGGTYKPVWLALGALALDLIVAVVLTSLLRRRLPHLGWRAVHVLAYAAWAVAVAHGLGIGTDAQSPWSVWVTVGCVAVVTLALTARLVGLISDRWRPAPVRSRADAKRWGQRS